MYEYSNGLVRRGHSVMLIHGYQRPADVVAAGVAHVRGRPPEGFWFDIDERVDFRIFTFEDPPPDADVILNAAFHAPSTPAMGVDVIILQGFGLAAEDDLAALDIRAAKVAVTRAIYERALAHGVPASEIAYVPNAIDHHQFRLLAPIEHRPPRVAMLCNTRLLIKGAPTGIEALRLAKARRPQLTAVLFGTDARSDALPDWIEFQRLPSREALAADIYNGSSIYLCPSTKDAFHLPAPEAMACGCALVTTDLGITEYADPGVTALVSPRNDPAGLADSIVRLVDDERLRASLARAGVRRVAQLDWDASVGKLERFFGELLRRRDLAGP